MSDKYTRFNCINLHFWFQSVTVSREVKNSREYKAQYKSKVENI